MHKYFSKMRNMPCIILYDWISNKNILKSFKTLYYLKDSVLNRELSFRYDDSDYSNIRRMRFVFF